MERHVLKGYRMTPELTGATSTLLREAGREPGNMERLRSAAITHRLLTSDTEAFVFPKLRPYAPGPGFDNMIFVAKEGGTICGIEDVRPETLSKLLGMGDRILEAYERNVEGDDSLAKEIIAINYHATPVAEEAFDRKLYAQSLRDLHLHVVGFRAQDVDNLPVLERERLTKDQYNELHEPLSFLIERLAAIPSILERLSHALTILRRLPITPAGIRFYVDTTDLKNPLLSQDLIQLHHNLANVYHELLGLFADPAQMDETGMPRLHDVTLREEKIRAFFEKVGVTEESHATLMHTCLRFSRLLKSGTEIRALSPAKKTDTPIFLRGLAYTLALIREPHTKEMVVTVSPRVLSTGNLLATLGYYKVTGEEPPEAWIAAKQRNEQVIAEMLG